MVTCGWKTTPILLTMDISGQQRLYDNPYVRHPVELFLQTHTIQVTKRRGWVWGFHLPCRISTALANLTFRPLYLGIFNVCTFTTKRHCIGRLRETCLQAHSLSYANRKSIEIHQSLHFPPRVLRHETFRHK